MSAVITTATDLNPAIISEIQKQLEKQLNAQIELTRKIDSSLIGGFVLRIDDQQVDASIACQLKKVKEKLLQSEIK